MKDLLISSAQFADAQDKIVYLYKKLWKESDSLLIHAPRTVDKTAVVLDIVSQIDRDVVYVNADTSLAAHCDTLKKPDRVSVFTPAFDDDDDEKTDYADLVIRGIEEIVASTDIRTFVVDSVTRIAALSFGRNASAAYVMKRLVYLQMRLHISLLIISHDTTKAVDRALLTLVGAELNLTDADQSVAESRPAANADSSDPSEKKSDPSESSEKTPVSPPSDNPHEIPGYILDADQARFFHPGTLGDIYDHYEPGIFC